MGLMRVAGEGEMGLGGVTTSFWSADDSIGVDRAGGGT